MLKGWKPFSKSTINKKPIMKPITRLSPTMRIVLAHLGLILLAGFFAIGSLLVEPSQVGGFLGFSAGRWVVLLVNLFVLAGVIFSVYKVWKNQTGKLEVWLSKENHLFWGFFLAIILFAFSLPAGMGRIPAIRYFAYFGRIRPSLLWLAFASGQFCLTLLFVLRKSILLWFRQFFPEAAVHETTNLSASQKYIVLGIVLVYLSLQVASHLKVRDAIWLPDSIDYIFPATTYNWNEPGLWTHTKPWGAAVLYKLTGSSPATIDAAQTLLSALAWLALAWVFSRSIVASWLRVTALVLILGFSLALSTQMWNHIIQSESLSISLMVLIVAFWLSLLQRWRWGKLFVLIILFGWWIGTRETNVYLSLMIAGILVLVGLFYKQQRFYWAVSAVLVSFCMVNMQISELPTIPRWLYPLTNIVLHRILPNEEYLAFFEVRGMPVSPELLSLSGGLANSGDFAVFNNPALKDVEDWLYRKGKDTYIHFLIRHPVYTLTSPWLHTRETLMATDFLSYAPQPIFPVMVWGYEKLIFLQSFWLLGMLVFTTTTAVLWARLWKISSFWLVFIFLLLFLPHFYLAWHGDAAEVGRHAIQASVQLRLALWLSLLLALDKIVKNDYRIRTRHRS
jgi:hypothetical protein